MTRHLVPRLAPLGILAALLCVPKVATAQFAVTAIELYDPDGNRRLIDTDIVAGYFNKANCLCKKSIRIRLRISIDRQNTDKFFVAAGSGTCIDTNQNSISETCKPLLKDGRIDQQDQDIEITTATDKITVADLMNGNCDTDQQLNIYVFTGQENTVTQAATLAFTADGIPPTAPAKDGDPQAGEELVRLSFKAGSTAEKDVRYQILCEVAATGAPGLSKPPTAGYASCATPSTTPSDGGLADGGLDDAGVDAPPVERDTGAGDGGAGDGPPNDTTPNDTMGARDAGVDQSPSVDSSGRDGGGSDGAGASGGVSSLDTRYVCSDILSSDGSAEIKGLKNGVKYAFYVVAFDLHGNPSSAAPLGEATPVLAEDLWERYKRAGGKAEGGYCAVGGTVEGELWFGGTLLGLLGLLLLGRRRTRPRGGGR